MTSQKKTKTSFKQTIRIFWKLAIYDSNFELQDWCWWETIFYLLNLLVVHPNFYICKS